MTITTSAAWKFYSGKGPVVATAIHNGHLVRPEIAKRLRLPDSEQRREEDPYTGDWTNIVDQRIVVQQSRFEFDLNRPRDKCVYEHPDDAWGLQLYENSLPHEIKADSLARYDAFYADALQFFTKIKEQHKVFFVYDIHSYNHRRDGPDSVEADSEGNPEINIGTGTMSTSQKWRTLVDDVMDQLSYFNFDGRKLDVRENIKFKGGYFPKWLHDTFPGSVCCLSLECKKFFMDEWTGQVDAKKHALIRQALLTTLPSILSHLNRICT